MKIVMAVVVLLLVALAIILSLPFLVDLARYQDQYRPIIEEALNRKIELQGIRLTIWPRLGARVRGFTVLDDPAFGTTPFASLSALDVGIKLMPLLGGKVEVEEIILRDPVIRVVKDKNGVLNVSTIGPKGASPPAVPAPEQRPVHEPLQALALLAVDRLTIDGGQLEYRDLSTHPPSEHHVQDLQLALNSVRLGETSTLHLTATVQPEHIPVSVDGSFGPLVQTAELQRYAFKIGLGKMEVDIEGALTHGKLDATVSSPSINTADVPARLPLTKPVQIKNLSVTVTGPYPFKQNVPAIELVDVTNLGLAVVMGGSVVDVKGNVHHGHAKVTITSPSINTGDLPVETGLKKPIELKNFQANAELLRQDARLSNLSFQLFDGQAKAQGTVTTGTPVPPFNGTAAVSGLQVAPALDVLSPGSPVSLNGVAAADLALAGRGFKTADLTTALEGSGHMEVKEGKIEGVNLMQEIVGLLKVAGLPVDQAKVTAFSTLETDFSVKHGLITLQKLLLDSHDFQATGGGTVGFDKAVDLKIALNLSPGLSQKIAGSSPIGKLMMKDGKLRLPLRVTGTAQNPTYSLDMKDMTGAVQEQVREKAKETVKGLLEGTTKPQDLKKQGEDLLKGLLGR
ncbi:MAG TPA: AsmA family protein [Nitrospira sp.]|nr:AsmA family protein [Nitrospira sp.]